MSKSQLEHLRMLSVQKDEEGINKFLDSQPNDSLLELLGHIVEDRPFEYYLALGPLLRRLYSRDTSFVQLLMRLMETTMSDWAFYKCVGIHLKELAEKMPEETISIFMTTLNTTPQYVGYSGFLISSLLGKGVMDEDIIANLKSKDPVKQKSSLVALGNLFSEKDKTRADIFLPTLLGVAGDIDSENTTVLFPTLLQGYWVDPPSVLSVLEREMGCRRYPAAIVYLRAMMYSEDFPVSLSKQAVQILEEEDCTDTELVDCALARIYVEDKEFVIERMRERLHDFSNSTIANWRLRDSIKKEDPSPIFSILEDELDSSNPRVVRFGYNILSDFSPSEREKIEWCQKWKDDPRKREAILRSLRHILTELMNYESSSLRDESISLVKFFADEEGLDYEGETKGINFGKDSNEGAMHREATIKALYVLDNLLSPPIEVDVDILQKNLEKYPHVCEALGKAWILKDANSGHPHIVTCIYSWEAAPSELSRATELFLSETDEKKKLGLLFKCNYLSSIINQQAYWERVFQTLSEHGITIGKAKLREPTNASSILAEAEILARLAPYFNVDVEPQVPELLPKILDICIEHNDQTALIEVATVKRSIELKVAQGAISLSGGKVKNVLLNKFQTQLKEGKHNPGMPVLIVLNLCGSADQHDVADAMYGKFQVYWTTRTDTQEIIENGTRREDNSFYREPNSEILSLVAAYKRDESKQDSLIGKMYRPPINPTNPLSPEFYLRLRNALFGDSESSQWESLMKIDGIDEDMARKLYSTGIEDLGVLAYAREDEFSLTGLSSSEIQSLQSEARRINNALATGSLQFLKTMDKETLASLTKQGIYLISQIAPLTTAPDGIDVSKWKEIVAEAKGLRG